MKTNNKNRNQIDNKANLFLCLWEITCDDKFRRFSEVPEDDEGRMLLPIFSDWVHLNESSPGKDGLVLSAEWAFSMAVEQYDGVVINHTRMALPIYKGFLVKILGVKNA